MHIALKAENKLRKQSINLKRAVEWYTEWYLSEVRDLADLATPGLSCMLDEVVLSALRSHPSPSVLEPDRH